MIAEHLPSDDHCFSASAHLLNEFDPHFYDSFTSAYHALQKSDNLPSTIIAHRMREVLMWLSLQGLYFNPAEKRTLSAKLRDI